MGARRGADASWIPALSRQELIDGAHDNLKNLGLDALDVVNLRVGGFGELFGLRWRDFNHDECLLELRETVYRGELRNWGKTRKALRPVYIPKELADDLWLWRQESKHSEPDDFIFPNRLRKSGFIDPQNYRRKMRKLGDGLGLPKLTFQVIRRTIATLGQMAINKELRLKPQTAEAS